MEARQSGAIPLDTTAYSQEQVANPETIDLAAEDTGESTNTPVEGDGKSKPTTEGGEEEEVPEPEPVKEPKLTKSQMT